MHKSDRAMMFFALCLNARDVSHHQRPVNLTAAVDVFGAPDLRRMANRPHKGLLQNGGVVVLCAVLAVVLLEVHARIFWCCWRHFDQATSHSLLQVTIRRPVSVTATIVDRVQHICEEGHPLYHPLASRNAGPLFSGLEAQCVKRPSGCLTLDGAAHIASTCC